MKDWTEYIEKTKLLPGRSLLVQAVSMVNRGTGRALDLGAGGLRDSRYLASVGFKVVAVDANSHILEEPIQGVVPVVSSIENFEFEDSEYDIVNAAYTLPFLSHESLIKVFPKLLNSIVTGGLFVGQFFGKNDGWYPDAAMSFHDQSSIKELLGTFTICYLEEKEYEGTTALGAKKHWHVYDVIAKKVS